MAAFPAADLTQNGTRPLQVTEFSVKGAHPALNSAQTGEPKSPG
jgi:hypothetical protein